jgi:hypothetical protein
MDSAAKAPAGQMSPVHPQQTESYHWTQLRWRLSNRILLTRRKRDPAHSSPAPPAEPGH